MEIRRARAEDVSSIVALYLADPVTGPQESQVEPLPEFYHEAFRAIDTDANETLLVAEVDGVIAGTAQVSITQHLVAQGLRRAVIEGVFVRPDYQGRGVGRKLMEAAIALAQERGCGAAELTSNKVRERAHEFYAKLGFEATHEGFKLALPKGR